MTATTPSPGPKWRIWCTRVGGRWYGVYVLPPNAAKPWWAGSLDSALLAISRYERSRYERQYGQQKYVPWYERQYGQRQHGTERNTSDRPE